MQDQCRATLQAGRSRRPGQCRADLPRSTKRIKDYTSLYWRTHIAQGKIHPNRIYGLETIYSRTGLPGDYPPDLQAGPIQAVSGGTHNPGGNAQTGRYGLLDDQEGHYRPAIIQVNVRPVHRYCKTSAGRPCRPGDPGDPGSVGRNPGSLGRNPGSLGRNPGSLRRNPGGICQIGGHDLTLPAANTGYYPGGKCHDRA